MIAGRDRVRAGFTFAEVIVVMAIMALLAASAVPRFTVAGEQTRVDTAAATLQSIWVAQRMHWMEMRTFAGDLGELTSLGLIESKVAAQVRPFTYTITSADKATFLAEADRSGSTEWSGTISIDEDGLLSGSVTNGEGRSVTPIAP